MESHPQSMHHLPPEVAALARRCGADPNLVPGAEVTMRQTGVMRADAAQPWKAFRARQTIAIDRMGFVWRARTGPLGCVSITDALEDAGGRLTVMALGVIPLVRLGADDKLTRGELLRYLAELPYSPDAILHNRGLQWEAPDANTLRVTGSHAGVSARIEFTLDPDGLIASAYAPDRPRLEGATTVERPWRCTISDYRSHQGRRLPFAGEAAWIIDGVETPVWRGRIEAWALGPPA